MKTRFILTSLALLAVGGCGSDSVNESPLPSVDTTDMIASGPVTGFGSVIVNGTEFQTDSASVSMDDEAGVLADLRVGMVVSVTGYVNTDSGVAYAEQIRFNDDAEGPISSIDHDKGSFVVLGKTFLADELTEFESGSFESLGEGNMVQVSGLWRNEERVQATHIRRIANAWQNGMTMEVKGEIADLDIGLHRFRIGTQWFDYSQASLELGGADIADGQYIQASCDHAPGDGDMILDRIQLRDRDRDRDRDHECDSDCNTEIEGYVTSFVSATEFEVDGQAVTTTDQTVYVNGTADTLAVDIKVKVVGTIDDMGVLVATRIVFRLPSVIEIDADIDVLDGDNGTITLLGIVVITTSNTMYHDHSAASVLEFGFDDLAVGDRVEIRAYMDGDSIFVTRVQREDPDDSVTLKALVEAIARPDITLLGIVVTADDETVFQNVSMEFIDADEFFELVAIDSIVKAEGTWNGTSILASKMFLRECESNCM